MQSIQTITTMKNPDQLTIPPEVRRALRWHDKELTVKIETTIDGFTVNRVPSSYNYTKPKRLTEKEWDSIYENMQHISKMGKQKVNLTKFIRRDRDTHF